MLFFDGVERSCAKFKVAKGGKLRCEKFEEGRSQPVCPGQGLKGGGRSQNYIRPKGKPCSKRSGAIKRRGKK